MSDAFRFETFVNVHGNIFNEYLSSVVARLSKEDEEYKALQAEIERLTAEKNARYNDYRTKKERVRELQTMKSNLSQMRRGEPSRQKKQEQER